MRKTIYFFTLVLLFLTGQFVNAQVTIGSNDDPKATLDVVASATDGSTAEGIIPPRLTGDQIKGKDARYDAPQKGAIVYATAAASPTTTKTANITKEGYYYFDGSVWQGLGGSSSVTSSRPNLIVTTDQNPSPAAAQFSADVTVIKCTYTGSALGTFTFPALTTADKGKLLQISVSTGGGAVGNFAGATNPALAGGNIPNLMGATFMWDGTTWFRYSR